MRTPLFGKVFFSLVNLRNRGDDLRNLFQYKTKKQSNRQKRSIL